MTTDNVCTWEYDKEESIWTTSCGAENDFSRHLVFNCFERCTFCGAVIEVDEEEEEDYE